MIHGSTYGISIYVFIFLILLRPLTTHLVPDDLSTGKTDPLFRLVKSFGLQSLWTRLTFQVDPAQQGPLHIRIRSLHLLKGVFLRSGTGPTLSQMKCSWRRSRRPRYRLPPHMPIQRLHTCTTKWSRKDCVLAFLPFLIASILWRGDKSKTGKRLSMRMVTNGSVCAHMVNRNTYRMAHLISNAAAASQKRIDVPSFPIVAHRRWKN